MKSQASYLRILIALVAVSGCAHSPTADEIRVSESIDFRAHDGTRTFRFEKTGAGIRIEDSTGARLATLRLVDESVHIDNAAGQLTARVLPPSDEERGFRVVTPDRSRPLLEMRLEPDGDIRVLDPQEALVYEVKLREYGFKVLDGGGELESKIRVKPDKISVRDRSGVTFLTTRDPVPPAAVAILSLEKVPFEIAAGLSVALAHWSPQP